MPNFNTFEARVSVDGTALPEYNVTTDEQSRTVTCWIPSEVGKKFSVKIGNAKLHSTLLLCDLFIDGKRIRRTDLMNGIGAMTIISSVTTSATTCRDLVFSSVELTDDDAFLDMTDVTDMGNISLKVFEVLQFRQVENTLSDTVGVPNGKVHERTKKVIGHRVGLGPEKSKNPSQRMFIVEKIGSVLATFLFKYRPMDILRADGIVSTQSPNFLDLKGKRKAEDGEDGNIVGGEMSARPQIRKDGAGHVQTRSPSIRTNDWPNKRVKIETHHPMVPLDLT